jgi:carbonic anhydrase
MVADLEQTVFGIVALTAIGTDQVAAPLRALAIVIFGHGECGATTARDQEHLQARLRLGFF